MIKIYDYIIIGGGPVGLTLAWYLSKYNKSVALIDKNKNIGGCFRTIRHNNLFSENSQKMTFNFYIMFKKVLFDMNIKFNDIYVKSNSSLNLLSKKYYNLLSFKEKLLIFYSFIGISNNNKKILLNDYLKSNNFSSKSISYIESLCQLLNGSDIKKITLYTFLQLINLSFLDLDLYIAKKPNDELLLKLWYNKLLDNNVKIFLSEEIEDIVYNNNNIINITSKNNNKYFGKIFIFAIPPVQLVNLLDKNKDLNVKNAFGDINSLKVYSMLTNYNKYIPLIFHWKKKYNFKQNIISNTEWNIIYSIKSDYMEFNDKRSKTVMVLTISNIVKSSFLKKTPDEIDNTEELSEEVIRQLKKTIPNLKYPDYIINNNVYYNNEWNVLDTAYLFTDLDGLKNKSDIFNNLYNCGAHNCLSKFYFNSIETAICNAISLLHDLEPDSKKDIKLKYKITLLDIILNVKRILIIFYLSNIFFFIFIIFLFFCLLYIIYLLNHYSITKNIKKFFK